VCRQGGCYGDAELLVPACTLVHACTCTGTCTLVQDAVHSGTCTGVQDEVHNVLCTFHHPGAQPTTCLQHAYADHHESMKVALR